MRKNRNLATFYVWFSPQERGKGNLIDDLSISKAHWTMWGCESDMDCTFANVMSIIIISRINLGYQSEEWVAAGLNPGSTNTPGLVR